MARPRKQFVPLLPYTDREEGDEDTAKSEAGSNYFDDISDDESYLVRQDMSGTEKTSNNFN